MIKVIPPVQPPHFDASVKQPGIAHLTTLKLRGKTHLRSSDFKPFWNEVLQDLKQGFNNLCGYSGMLETGRGEVDHYISKTADSSKAYDWTNYRFAGHDMNNRKSVHDEKILDPFEIEDGFFRINENTFELEIAKDLRTDLRVKAEFTIKQLELNSTDYIYSRLCISALAICNKGNLKLLKALRRECPLLVPVVEAIWKRPYDGEQTLKMNAMFESFKIVLENED